MRLFIALFLSGFTVIAHADVAVLTQHNDINRSGANLNETILNTGNVNTNSFGLIRTLPLDDQVYAQPLIVTNVDLGPAGVHNLVIVCTVNDTVYAFDADDATVTAPYWTNSFTNLPTIVAPLNSDMTGACQGFYTDFVSHMGIVSTPVIDPASGTMYVVVRTKENDVDFVQRLHALDITTGLDRSNSPAILTATYPGDGPDNLGGILTFDSQHGNQRAGLLLLDGVVYVCWSSHCDWDPYHGWVMGYDATTLRPQNVFNSTPNGARGGIWMSGQAPAADANGNLYLSTGNGSFDGVANFGDCLVRLAPNDTNLTVTSWFAPYNWSDLNDQDLDLGSCGILLIPNTTLALTGGKEAVLYLVDRDNMGQVSDSGADTNILQSWSLSANGVELHGGPVWWDGPDGSYAYVWPGSEHLHQYQFDWTNQIFNTTAVFESPTAAPFGQPGGILAVSANGTNAGTGIVWASHPFTGDAEPETRPGILRAYDAQDVSQELWNSEKLSARDSVGNFAKFVPPTIANGKVYLATFSSQLDVFGLLPRPALNVSAAGPNALALSWSTNFTGFHVQASADLAATWLDDTNTIALTNGDFQVTVPTGTASKFYRLIR